MIVKCSECGKHYERFNVGEYGYPYKCDSCKGGKILFLAFLILCTILAFSIVVSAEDIKTYKTTDCINIKKLCSNCTSSNITSIDAIKDPSFSFNISQMDRNGFEFNYSFCDHSSQGIYSINGVYDLNGADTPWTLDINLTPSGIVPSVSMAILYSLVLFFIIVLFLLSLYFSITIQFKNGSNPEGKISKINYLKHIKLFLCFMTYLLFLLIVSIVYDISLNFFQTTESIQSTFNYIYTFLISAIVPIFLATIVFMIVLAVEDNKIQKALKRGLSPR